MLGFSVTYRRRAGTKFPKPGSSSESRVKAGAYAYLVKPFEEDDLLDCINRALKQQDATRPGEEH